MKKFRIIMITIGCIALFVLGFMAGYRFAFAGYKISQKIILWGLIILLILIAVLFLKFKVSISRRKKEKDQQYQVQESEENDK